MAPTSDQWLDLDQIGQRTDQFRFDLVNSTLDVSGTLDVRSDIVPTVTNNIHAAIKRTLTMAPKSGALDDISLLSARVRPVMILPNSVEYNLGVFMFADMSAVRWSYGTDPTPTLVDQTLIVDQPTTQSRGFAAGASITAAIEDLLAAAGISSFDVAAAGATLGSPMAWPPGTSRLEIIDALAAAAGCYSLYFDNYGTARVIQVPTLDAANLAYTTTRPRILQGSIVESNDTLDAPNRFIVISSTGYDSSPVVGRYDIEDDAPHSAKSRGFVVARVMTVDGLSSSAQATATAMAWAKQSASAYEWMQFASPLDPRHDTFDVVAVELDAVTGPVLWREQGWSMPLQSGGAMTHDLRRSYT